MAAGIPAQGPRKQIAATCIDQLMHRACWNVEYTLRDLHFCNIFCTVGFQVLMAPKPLKMMYTSSPWQW